MTEIVVAVIYSHWLFRLPFMKKYDAITFGSRILFREPKNRVPDRLIRHEAKHVEQVRRLGAFRFYSGYLLEYAAGRARGLSHETAYRAISYELEATVAEAAP